MKKMVIRRRKRNRYKRVLRAGLVIITLALLAVFCAFLYRRRPLPVVTLTVSKLTP